MIAFKQASQSINDHLKDILLSPISCKIKKILQIINKLANHWDSGARKEYMNF